MRHAAKLKANQFHYLTSRSHGHRLQHLRSEAEPAAEVAQGEAEIQGQPVADTESRSHDRRLQHLRSEAEPAAEAIQGEAEKKGTDFKRPSELYSPLSTLAQLYSTLYTLLYPLYSTLVSLSLYCLYQSAGALSEAKRPGGRMPGGRGGDGRRETPPNDKRAGGNETGHQ